MPIGPRLDRPSAVGDEGRPRATSLGVATGVVLVVVVATGVALGDPTFFTGAGLLVGLTVAGMALLDRDRVRETVVGHLLFLHAASVLLLAVFLTGEPWLVVAGAVAALGGVGGAWADIGDGPSLKHTLTNSLLSYVFGLVWLALAGAGLAAVYGFWTLATGLSGVEQPMLALVGLSFVVGVVCLCLRLAVWAVPAVELAPRDREARVARRLRRLGRRLVFLWAVSFVLVWVLGMAALSGQFDGAAGGPLALAVGTLTSRVVMVPLVLVGVASVGVAVVATTARKATSEYDAAMATTVAAALGGAGYVAIIGILVLSAGFLPVAAVVIVLAGVAVPLLVYLAVTLAVVAVEVGAVPRGATPLALSAAGLVAVAVGAAGIDPPAVLVFAATAGALVVWDVSTFGLGVTAELGHLPATRRLELYHGVFAVGVGVATVALLTATDALVRPVGASVGTPAAMGVATLAVVVLLVSLRA
jgi:hypothetical protein